MLRIRTFVILIMVYLMAVITLRSSIDLTYPYKLVRNYLLMPIRASTKNNKFDNSEYYQKTLILELQDEIKKLKEITKIETILSDYDNIYGTVISRNRNYWFNTITIDKGKIDGVELDMAVISSHSLIGKISQVSRNISEVKLITTSDVNNKTSVVINGDSKIYGIIEKYQNGYLEVTLISKVMDITKGLTVMTTGMGGIYPSGILIGTVEGTKKAKYDVGMIVLVKPASEFNDLRYISVLKRK